jgi:polyisoprenyl-phosphate glycosyltransferase
MFSIIVPVYRSEANLPWLVAELERIAGLCPLAVEVVFVIDGSPDRSALVLRDLLPQVSFSSRLASLTRNFGTFNAIRCGMEIGSGDYLTALPADLQEPADLALRFLDFLQRGEADIVFATRSSRSDPWLSSVASRLFWRLYRRFVVPELPTGGVHAFACTRAVRDRLIELREPTFNLFALLFWVGCRRVFLPYDRGPRRQGRSAWTLTRKLRYAFDSIFSFTDLPIRLLLVVGSVGVAFAVILGVLLLSGWLAGRSPVPGYTTTSLLVLFFGSITSLGIGILGQYIWLVLQTARGRPDYLIERVEAFRPTGTPEDDPPRRN